MAGRSAIIVPILLPPALGAVRDALDPMAMRGVPAHVTILYPFLGAEDLGATDRASLAAIAQAHGASVARFDRVERRDGFVWVLPADQGPFLALTASVVERWPDHPPYGGAHEVLIAHLTLVETDDGSILDRVSSLARAHGPFDAAVTELLVIAESTQGTWPMRWRFPLVPGLTTKGRC